MAKRWLYAPVRYRIDTEYRSQGGNMTQADTGVPGAGAQPAQDGQPPPPAQPQPNAAQDSSNLWTVVTICATLLLAMLLAWLFTRGSKTSFLSILGLVTPVLTAIAGGVFGVKAGSSQAKSSIKSQVLPKVSTAKGQASNPDVVGQLQDVENILKGL